MPAIYMYVTSKTGVSPYRLIRMPDVRVTHIGYTSRLLPVPCCMGASNLEVKGGRAGPPL